MKSLGCLAHNNPCSTEGNALLKSTNNAKNFPFFLHNFKFDMEFKTKILSIFEMNLSFVGI